MSAIKKKRRQPLTPPRLRAKRFGLRERVVRWAAIAAAVSTIAGLVLSGFTAVIIYIAGPGPPYVSLKDEKETVHRYWEMHRLLESLVAHVNSFDGNFADIKLNDCETQKDVAMHDLLKHPDSEASLDARRRADACIDKLTRNK